MDPLEDRVRRGLHDDRWRVSPLDPDDALSRVYAGAARRRRRRHVATAVVGVVAVAGAAGGIGLLTDGPNTGRDNTVATDRDTSTKPDPTPTRTPGGSEQGKPNGKGDDPAKGDPNDGKEKQPNDPGTDVTSVPPEFHAVSMTASSTTNYWVLGGLGSNKASVAATSDGGQSFEQAGTIDAPVPSADDAVTPDTVRDIRFVDSEFGWAYGGGLWSTADGGRHWERSTTFAGSVEQLEIDNGRAYALVRSGDSWSLWRSAATSDSWEQLSPDLVDPEGLAVTGDLVAVTDRSGGATVAWVSENGGGEFDSRPTQCSADLAAGELSASEGSLWLKCATGTAAEVWLSRDAGQNWTTVNTGPESLPNTGSEVGARSATEAVTAMPGEVRSIEPSGPGQTSVPDLGQPVYTGFTTSSVGYVVDLDGNLFRTANGGESWSEIPVE